MSPLISLHYPQQNCHPQIGLPSSGEECNIETLCSQIELNSPQHVFFLPSPGTTPDRPPNMARHIDDFGQMPRHVLPSVGGVSIKVITPKR